MPFYPIGTATCGPDCRLRCFTRCTLDVQRTNSVAVYMWDITCERAHLVRVTSTRAIGMPITVATMRWNDIVRTPTPPFYINTDYSTEVTWRSPHSTVPNITYQLFHFQQKSSLLTSPHLLNKEFATAMLHSAARWYGTVCAVVVLPEGFVRDITHEDCVRLKCALSRALLDRTIDFLPLTTGDILGLPLFIDPVKNVIGLVPSDIHLAMFVHFDFGDLVNLAHTCRDFRKLVQTYINRRMHVGLSAFFGQSVSSIMTTVKLANGCIGGCFVNAVFNHLLPVGDLPRNIDIFICRSAATEAIESFKEVLNVGDPTEIEQKKPMKMAALSTLHWSIQGGRCMTLVISKNYSVLPPLFCSDTTADLVAYTGQSLVSFYPRMTIERVALPTLAFLNELRTSGSSDGSTSVEECLRSIGVKFERDNEHWRRNCGLECPPVLRSSTERIGVLSLNDDIEDTVFKEWMETEGQWRLGDECLNNYCYEE